MRRLMFPLFLSPSASGGGRINLDDWGSARPKITQDDLEEDVVIMTITGFEQGTFGQGKDERKLAMLFFEESGDKVLYCSKIDLTALVDRLGDKPGDWTGEKCPIEKVKRKFGTETFNKVGVVPADEWDQYLKPRASSRRSSGGKKKRR